MHDDQHVTTEQQYATPSVPFPPGRIAICPLCGLDIVTKTAWYREGVVICRACDRHCFPDELDRRLRLFRRVVDKAEIYIHYGNLHYIPRFHQPWGERPNWYKTLSNTALRWLDSIPLFNVDWIERDETFDGVVTASHIATMCQTMADRRRESVGGFQPRFPIASKSTTTTESLRDREPYLPFAGHEG